MSNLFPKLCLFSKLLDTLDTGKVNSGAERRFLENFGAFARKQPKLKDERFQDHVAGTSAEAQPLKAQRGFEAAIKSIGALIKQMHTNGDLIPFLIERLEVQYDIDDPAYERKLKEHQDNNLLVKLKQLQKIADRAEAATEYEIKHGKKPTDQQVDKVIHLRKQRP